MFMGYDLDIKIFRNDMLSIKQAKIIRPDYILISPGPRDPAHAGISMPLIKAFYDRIPVLGVCLGMQCINEVFGGETVRAPLPVHGKTTQIRHSGQDIFQNVISPVTVARYHSLAVKPDNSQNALRITAETDDNIIMGIAHNNGLLSGVQFHPESFLTQHGITLIENFLLKGILGESRLASQYKWDVNIEQIQKNI